MVVPSVIPVWGESFLWRDIGFVVEVNPGVGESFYLCDPDFEKNVSVVNTFRRDVVLAGFSVFKAGLCDRDKRPSSKHVLFVEEFVSKVNKITFSGRTELSGGCVQDPSFIYFKVGIIDSGGGKIVLASWKTSCAVPELTVTDVEIIRSSVGWVVKSAEGGTFSKEFSGDGRFYLEWSYSNVNKKNSGKKYDFNISGVSIDPFDGGVIPPFLPPEDYLIKVDCEAAGYYWYNGLCHAEPESEPAWWQTFLSVANQAMLSLVGPRSELQAAYKLITGVDLDDSEYDRVAGEIGDWVGPVNALSKLIEGKNLKGENESFGSAQDWIDIGLNAFIFVPGAKAGKVFSKLESKAISDAVKRGMYAIAADKNVAVQMGRNIIKYPVRSVNWVFGIPPVAKEIIVEGLSVTDDGVKLVVDMAEKGFFKGVGATDDYIKIIDDLVKKDFFKGVEVTDDSVKLVTELAKKGSLKGLKGLYEKVMSFLTKHYKPIVAVTLPIFAITEIPNLFNMRIFARTQIKKDKGEYPPDIDFDLSNYEGLLKQYTFDIDADIKADRLVMAKDKLDLMKTTLQDYTGFVNDKAGIMHSEDYDISLNMIAFYQSYVDDRGSRLSGVIPPPPPPPPTNGDATLILTSIPPGTSIMLDGVLMIDKTPVTLTVSSGSHELVLSKAGYVDKAQSFIVSSDEIKALSIVLDPVSTPPPPPPPDDGAEKEITLFLEKFKYNAWKVTIKAKDVDTLEDLSAAVYIDGVQQQYATPSFYFLAPSSTYQIRLLKSGYKPADQTLILPALPEV